MNQKQMIAAGVVLAAFAVWYFWPKKEQESIIAGDITLDEFVPAPELDYRPGPSGEMVLGEPEIIRSDAPDLQTDQGLDDLLASG